MRLGGRGVCWVAIAGALAVLAVGGGCKKGGDPDAPATASAGSGATTPVAPAGPAPLPGFAPSRAVLGSAAALATLPKDTLFVAVAESLEGLTDRLGRSALVARVKGPYDELARAVTEVLGANALEPKNLATFGIDPTKPVGFFWLDAKDETFGVFVTLSDGTKLTAFLEALATKYDQPLSKETVGDATILTLAREGELGLVIRGSSALVVVSDEGDEEGIAARKRLAGVVAADSLAKDAGLLAAMDRLAYGKDVAAYFNIPALVALFEKHLAGDDADENAQRQRQLDDMRAAGASPEAIAANQARMKEDDEWRARHRMRRMAIVTLLRSVFGTPGGLAIGAELDARALLLKAVLPVTGPSALLRVVRNAEGAPLLATVLAERPLAIAGATIDVTALLDSLRAFAGEEMAEARKELREELLIDYETDVLALLTGEVELAITGALPVPPESEHELLLALGHAVVLGVKDAAKAKALLARIAALPMAAPIMKKDAATGDYEIVVPDWKSTWIGVRGQHLVATTDKALLARLEAREKGGAMAAFGHPALAELVLRPGAGAACAIELRTLLFPLVAHSAPVPSAVRAATATGTADPAVPPSAEYTAKKLELDKLQADLAAAEAADATSERELFRTLGELLGSVALRLEVAPDGLVAYGGQFVGTTSVPAFAGEVGELIAQQLAREGARRAKWDLYERTFELQRTVDDLRDRDIERGQVAAPPALEGAAPTPTP